MWWNDTWSWLALFVRLIKQPWKPRTFPLSTGLLPTVSLGTAQPKLAHSLFEKFLQLHVPFLVLKISRQQHKVLKVVTTPRNSSQQSFLSPSVFGNTTRRLGLNRSSIDEYVRYWNRFFESQKTFSGFLSRQPLSPTLLEMDKIIQIEAYRATSSHVLRAHFVNLCSCTARGRFL